MADKIIRVIFSPHIDDSFLSLGGSILNWLSKGEVVHPLETKFPKISKDKRKRPHTQP